MYVEFLSYVNFIGIDYFDFKLKKNLYFSG